MQVLISLPSMQSDQSAFFAQNVVESGVGSIRLIHTCNVWIHSKISQISTVKGGNSVNMVSAYLLKRGLL